MFQGEVSISIDHPEKLLEVGDSVDISKCAFIKQDGANCVNIVNKVIKDDMYQGEDTVGWNYFIENVKRSNIMKETNWNTQNSFSN